MQVSPVSAETSPAIAEAVFSSGHSITSGREYFTLSAAARCALCTALRPETSAGSRPLSIGEGRAAASGSDNMDKAKSFSVSAIV